MKKLITFSFFPNRELLFVIIVALVVAGYFNYIVNNLYWASFFCIVFFVLLLSVKMKNSTYKLAVVIFALIFIEFTFVGRRGPFPVFEFGISTLFALTILSFLLYQEKRKWNLGSFTYLWILFLFTGFISIIIGGYRDYELMIENINSFQTFYLEFFLFFYLGFLIFSYNNASDIKKFFFVMLVFGGLVAIVHIYCLETGINLEDFRGTTLGRRDLSAGKWRYGSFFGNPNNMCTFYVMCIPSGIFLILSEKIFLKRIVLGALIATMSLSLLFSGSRAGVIYVLVNSIFVLFFLKKRWQVIIPGILILLLAIYITDKILHRYFLEFLERSTDLFLTKGWISRDRFIIWNYVYKIIFDNPLGIGLSLYNYIPVVMGYGCTKLPHNIYLYMAIQTGVCGLIAFLILVGKTIVLNIKAYLKTKDLNNKEVLSLLFLFISGFLLFGITEPIFTNQAKLNHIFGLMLGISNSFSYRLLRKNEEKIPKFLPERDGR